ncbi:beta-parvin isoform X1 [Symphalangus syndactylus]|uniref:beta-parvin isoform X1 n=1 Tax=Symphalangus syndactylus TaxID=9590 RepID=UPI003005996C
MSSAPRSPTPRPRRMKKDESFLGKLGGTLARKRRAREVSDLQEEGKNAINSPMSPALVDVHPEDTQLEENEERTMIDPTSKEDPKFKELVKVLLDWINDVLVEERIIVKQLEEDLYDGQVLQKLLEKLAGCKLNVAEVTQSEIGQKQKLQTVLEAVHDLLRPRGWVLRWSVDSIHGKNLVAILHLLVSLAMHFRAPIRLPEHVTVQVVVVRKREGLLHSSHISEELTTTTEMMTGRFERDAFDTLFDHAPDKLSVVKKSLITFVNKHLNKLNLEVTELETQVCAALAWRILCPPPFAVSVLIPGGAREQSWRHFVHLTRSSRGAGRNNHRGLLSPSVFLSRGCCHKTPQTEWPKQQSFVSSKCWRPKSKVKVGPGWAPSKAVREELFLAPSQLLGFCQDL